MHGSSNEAGPPLVGATLDGAGLADPAPVTDYRVRPATAADADAICRIYNQGIEDRVATLETELPKPEERRPRAPRGPDRCDPGLHTLVGDGADHIGRGHRLNAVTAPTRMPRS